MIYTTVTSERKTENTPSPDIDSLPRRIEFTLEYRGNMAALVLNASCQVYCLEPVIAS